MKAVQNKIGCIFLCLFYIREYTKIYGLQPPKNALARSEAYVVTPLISKTEDVATIANG